MQQALESRVLQLEQTPEPPDPPTLAKSLEAIRNPAFLLSPRYTDQQSRAKRSGAHPSILEFERRFIRRFERLGVPMFAHNMVRDESEQRALYVQGVTKAIAGQSPHNFGCAVDLVSSTLAWNIPLASWGMIGHIGKEVAAQAGIRVTWGGDWKFYDPAHWELANWRELKEGYPFDEQRKIVSSLEDWLPREG